ncbi:hypothetical protein BLNAU_18060 [Blattamonas nauphoetae]|uniref:Uncharacterized protein n=1 Tax=Blattamonas nauphoetae TaxID=2049346 RepID=A0ABQ9X6N1_9EUKA|nr:hypothetical protein BLNAU_18060 [Blattamonas nauphoetae]
MRIGKPSRISKRNRFPIPHTNAAPTVARHGLGQASLTSDELRGTSEGDHPNNKRGVYAGVDEKVLEGEGGRGPMS